MNQAKPKGPKVGLYLCEHCAAVHLEIESADGEPQAHVWLSAEIATAISRDLKALADEARARRDDDGIGKAEGSA